VAEHKGEPVLVFFLILSSPIFLLLPLEVVTSVDVDIWGGHRET